MAEVIDLQKYVAERLQSPAEIMEKVREALEEERKSVRLQPKTDN